jgi:hypothetical protein
VYNVIRPVSLVHKPSYCSKADFRIVKEWHRYSNDLHQVSQINQMCFVSSKSEKGHIGRNVQPVHAKKP